MPRIPDDAPVYSMAVAERITSLTRRQIRYYESMGLLRPQRTPGNRRLYSPADLRRLAEVKRLLEDGLDLRAIAGLARDGRLDTSGPAPAEGGAATKGLEVRSLGAYEDARARLLGRGPGGSLDSLYPGDSGRFGAPRAGSGPASWLRLPVRPAGPPRPGTGTGLSEGDARSTAAEKKGKG